MTTVPTTVGTRSRLRVPTAARLGGRTALASLVVALVVGILGMHALTSHGTHAGPAAWDTMSTAGPASARHSATPSTDTHADDPGSGSGHGMDNMVMLCVVMLAAAALTLLVRLAGGSFGPLLPAAFKPAAVRERVLQWVRGTGPPPVWAFSVIRC